MNYYQNLTWDNIKVMYTRPALLMEENEQKLTKMFEETGQQIKETGQQIKETWRQIKGTDKQIKETDKQIKETWRQIKGTDKQIKETWQQIKETGQQIKESGQRMDKNAEEASKRGAELDARLDRLGRYLGGISNSNGDVAEEYFYYTLKRDKTFVNEKFDYIRQNVSYIGEAHVPEMECDILLFNGKSAAIIEVKYNAKPDNVKVDALVARVEKFKAVYPKYKNHNIYLGVAALSFKKSLVKELHQAGIATIHQVGKKMVMYDKDVKAF